MAIKIIDSVLLSEGQLGLELKRWPFPDESAEFYDWAAATKIAKYVDFRSFYTAECIGDMDHPAIQVKKGAPKRVVTLCLLRWS